MTTRCKMRLSGVTKYETGETWWTYKKGVPHDKSAGNMEVADLEFTVVGRDNDPDNENNDFFASTPGGSIKLSVTNAEAVKELLNGMGKEFYVDFSLAPGQEGTKPKVYEKRQFSA